MYATHGLPTIVRDIVTVLARVGLGVTFMAHGWQKLNEWTVAGTTASFTQMGVPMPGIAAPFATFVELIGGALLILGALTPIVGALLAVNMIGAFFIVHMSAGPFVDQGGWELVAALAAGALLLAACGPGRFSVDQLLFSSKRGKSSRGAKSSASSRAAAEA